MVAVGSRLYQNMNRTRDNVRQEDMFLTPTGERRASTVLLLRDTIWGMEVYVQERSSTMRHYADMTVFPGGGVDQRDMAGRTVLAGHAPGAASGGDILGGEADASGDITWVGHTPEWWARHLRVPVEDARALVCAAVRETFEESGTLLAGHRDGTVVADTKPYLDYRERLESHEVALSTFLHETDLTLRADLLRPWANWVSPPQDSARYDTHFFVAAQPQGQMTHECSREASYTGWFRPSTLLDGWRYRKIRLMPPTWVQIRLLDTFRTVDEVLGYAQDLIVEPVTGAVEDRPFMDEYVQLERGLGVDPQSYW